MVFVLVVSMSQSSCKVKLNRVVFKHIDGLTLMPRRRRIQESPGKVVPQTPEEKKLDLCGTMSVNEATDKPVRNKLIQNLSSDRTRRKTVSRSASDMPEREAVGKGSGPERQKRKKDVCSCTEGPDTRDNKNSHLSRTGLSGTGVSLRRAVGGSCCALCGDSKYIFPQQTRQHKQGLKRRSPSTEQPTVTFQDSHNPENPDTKLSKKSILWIDPYPKVTLCDLAQYCDICSHKCGFVLSDVAKTKVLHCFKKDVAGFQFGPRCLRHKKHKIGECALAKGSELIPRACLGKLDNRSQSERKHQTTMTKQPEKGTLSTANIFKGWTGQVSATCSASFLIGKCTNQLGCRTNLWARDVKDSWPEEEVCEEKKPSIGKSSNGIVLNTLDLERINCNETAKPGSLVKEETYSCISHDSQSSVELSANTCSYYDSTVKENMVHKRHCDLLDEPRKTSAVQMSSELLNQRNEENTNSLEQEFTCQRVRPFIKKMHFSCARTYKPWPFSNSGCDLGSHACTTGCPADSSPVIQSNTLNSRTTDKLSNAPTDPSSDTTYLISHRSEEEQHENSKSSLDERNLDRHDNNSSCYSDSRNVTEAEQSVPSPLSNTDFVSVPNQLGREPGTAAVSAVFTPVSGQEINSSISTPSPSVLGLSDWETATTFSPVSSPITHIGLSSLSGTPSSLPPLLLLRNVQSVEVSRAHFTNPSSASPKRTLKTLEKNIKHFEETQAASCNVALSHSLNSLHSCQSSPMVPHEKRVSDEGNFLDGSLPNLEPFYMTSPFNLEHSIPKENCVEIISKELMILPLLSPVTSPQPNSWPRSLPHHQEEMNKDPSKPKIFLEHHLQKCLEQSNEESNGILTPKSTSDINDQNEEEGQNENEYKDDGQEGHRSSDEGLLDPKLKTTPTSAVLTETRSFTNSEEDDDGVMSDEGQQLHFAREEGLSPPEVIDHERETAAGDTQLSDMDEFTAYEQDILLVNVTQDDPELFENLPEKSLLEMGPTRVSQVPKTGPAGEVKMLSQRPNASQELKQRLTPVNVYIHVDSSDITEERQSRPWRPQCSSITSKESNACPTTDKQARDMGQSDINNNYVSTGVERIQPIQNVNSSKAIPSLLIRNGPRITNPNTVEFRHQKSNAYCRQYFSESQSCGFKMCWFQHVPLDGDEKFCIETVLRFTKNPMCLHKAGAVFTGYYINNPPGLYFSKPVLLALLWALLKAGMVHDIFSVLSVSLAHKIVPSLDFLLALFNFVREKGLMTFVPELMQLTFQTNYAGLLDCLDSVRIGFQHAVHPASPASMLSIGVPFPEYLNLVQSIVEIELCTQQENWRRMGEVFKSICQFSQHPNQVERISGRIATALLSESKDMLSLPFAAFAETVCQNEDEDSLIRSFLGRIGVSLMLRYHKTHQWAKGRRVVEVLLMSKVNYSTLKGLFGSEEGASRCCLVTVAAELFLLSGSVEGALKTLRENYWFLSSTSWPCEPSDLESRSCVMMRLAEKTSHRDTLEVLCNLPGIKEATDIIDVARYSPLFNFHLQVCVERQVLPVAADTVDFMLSKKLPVDHRVLQTLLHKLGKQNLWLRAREVFRHSLSVGYYSAVSAPTGFMSMIVPCQLGEVELALTFEMFITVNATIILQLSGEKTSPLSITLKRTQSCEREYLSAGSRLLSAASIPQPKLIVHYTAVNASQEQVFTLDISSAQRWLRHNHLWANEVWLQ